MYLNEKQIWITVANLTIEQRTARVHGIIGDVVVEDHPIGLNLMHFFFPRRQIKYCRAAKTPIFAIGYFDF